MQQATRELVPCACGCGFLIDPVDRFGRPRRFIKGHVTRTIRSKGRKSKKRFMALSQARRIAGALGKTRKMPGYSYGLDAFACRKGSELAEVAGSTCEHCFARKDLYLWKGVRQAHAFRLEAIDHPMWVPAMIELISHHCLSEPWFRWHDSGDLMSVEHLGRIVEVCKATPNVRHWLPTREYLIVRDFLDRGGETPLNLTIRLSAYLVEERARVPEGLEHLPQSTVHENRGEPVLLDQRNHSIECRAYTRGNQCGSCRACWSPKVKNVSYAKH